MAGEIPAPNDSCFMIKFTQELIKKNKLRRNSYYKQNPYLEIAKSISTEELALLEKWQCYTAKGHYGISLGNPTPKIWFKTLNSFLKQVKKHNPLFEIQQIKIKFGGIRIYLANINKETQESIQLLEAKLHDDHLIY